MRKVNMSVNARIIDSVLRDLMSDVDGLDVALLAGAERREYDEWIKSLRRARFRNAIRCTSVRHDARDSLEA
jgi:hypothetical protein